MAAKKTATDKKKTAKDGFKITKKRSGRFAVVNTATGKYVNGADKVAVLVGKGLIKEIKAKAAPAADAPAQS